MQACGKGPCGGGRRRLVAAAAAMCVLLRCWLGLGSPYVECLASGAAVCHAAGVRARAWWYPCLSRRCCRVLRQLTWQPQLRKRRSWSVAARTRQVWAADAGSTCRIRPHTAQRCQLWWCADQGCGLTVNAHAGAAIFFVRLCCMRASMMGEHVPAATLRLCGCACRRGRAPDTHTPQRHGSR